MIVREYRPTFIDIDAPLRWDRIENVTDALQIVWIRELRGVKIVDDEFVKTAEGYVVAIIQDEAVH